MPARLLLADAVRLEVIGDPVPQGSKKAFIAWRHGKPAAILKDDNEAALKRWRRLVASKADLALSSRQNSGLGPFDGATLLDVEFRFLMPKTRPARLRHAGVGKKTTAPDVDKLLRAIGDAVGTDSRLVHDDARFSDVRGRKREVTDPRAVGCSILIARIVDPDEADPQPIPTL